MLIVAGAGGSSNASLREVTLEEHSDMFGKDTILERSAQIDASARSRHTLSERSHSATSMKGLPMWLLSTMRCEHILP